MMLESTLQVIFKKLSLVKFWNSIKAEQPQLSKKTIKILLFSTSRLWTAGFSSYTSIKRTYGNRLNIYLTIQLSSIKPNIQKICKNKMMGLYSLLFFLESIIFLHKVNVIYISIKEYLLFLNTLIKYFSVSFKLIGIDRCMPRKKPKLLNHF